MCVPLSVLCSMCIFHTMHYLVTGNSKSSCMVPIYPLCHSFFLFSTLKIILWCRNQGGTNYACVVVSMSLSVASLLHFIKRTFWAVTITTATRNYRRGQEADWEELMGLFVWSLRLDASVTNMTDTGNTSAPSPCILAHIQGVLTLRLYRLYPFPAVSILVTPCATPLRQVKPKRWISFQPFFKQCSSAPSWQLRVSFFFFFYFLQ